MPSEFRGETNLFGVRVVLRSNHAGTLRLALSIFGKWDCAERSTRNICVALHARDMPSTMSDCARVTGPHLNIVQHGIALRADGRRGVGICVFYIGDVESDALHEAIHTIVLFLVAHAGRTPVHASAVMIATRAIVLAGRSGSGKSSLALAADRAGLPVLSEDSVFVQSEPSFRVWGMPEAIHVLEGAASAPGCAGDVRVRAGRAKRIFPIARPQTTANHTSLCVITRRDAVRLEKIPQDEAVRELTETPEPGFDYYGADFEHAIRAIAAGGCWRLAISDDPDAAIALLTEVFAEPNA